jgi:hypothetical protein
MAFNPVPGVAQIVLSGTYGGSETIVNVVHVARKNDAAFAPFTQPQLRDAALRLSLAWQQILPNLSTVVAYTEAKSRDMSSETGAVDLLPLALVGGSGSEPTSPNVAYLLQWRTGRAGRGANGRSYLPGVTEGSIDGMGRLVAAVRQSITDRAELLRGDLGAATDAIHPGTPLDMVVVHGPKGVPAAASSSVVVAGRCSNLVATQRRRLPKRA